MKARRQGKFIFKEHITHAGRKSVLRTALKNIKQIQTQGNESSNVM